jgi:hypothetical protein
MLLSIKYRGESLMKIPKVKDSKQVGANIQIASQKSFCGIKLCKTTANIFPTLNMPMLIENIISMALIVVS